MTRIWYCRNCGYEVRSRGRCHNCREKFTPSALPELEAGSDDEEVGYRIDGWPERDRGRLIERLNDLGIVHRFEDEELVVDASDEDRVDDLVAVLADSLVADEHVDGDDGDGTGFDDLDGSGAASGRSRDQGGSGRTDPADPALDAAVRLLADAASRLHRDPTDMQADADVAQASAAVFIPERYGALDEETWAAVGRVTRRLLSLLGAEEALDDGIRADAAVLEKLLAPVSGGFTLGPEGVEALGGAAGAVPAGAVTAGAVPDEVPGPAADAGIEGEKTVYEVPDWLPEQRAQLGVFLDNAKIAHRWDGTELVVPADRESVVETLFNQVDGVDPDGDDAGDEARYQAVAELFAACRRLASDPTDGQRQEVVLDWIRQSAGPPLLGMDDVDWLRISSHARTLEAAIEDGEDIDLISQEADTLHDMLRAVV